MVWKGCRDGLGGLCFVMGLLGMSYFNEMRYLVNVVVGCRLYFIVGG